MTARPKHVESKPAILTIDEWLSYDVPEGLHAELVHGVLEMNPLAAEDHQFALFQAGRQFHAYIARRPDEQLWFSSPGRLPIPGLNCGREPDLAVYDRFPHSGGGPPAWKGQLPLVVMEVVSEGQEIRDYVDKRREYYLAKIPEYWIADLKRRCCLVLRRGEAGWNEIQFGEAGTYTTPLLPGFELDISKLWLPPVPAPPASEGERSERPRGARADSSPAAAEDASSRKAKKEPAKRVKRPR